MATQVKSAWLTPAAVVLLFFGSVLLDMPAVAVVAAVLLVVGLRFTPAAERRRGGLAAAVGFAVALAVAVVVRFTS